MDASSPVHRDASTQTPIDLVGSDQALRRRLGLRPVVYPDRWEHPDTRPCPPWCWVTRSDGVHRHEIVAAHPMRALHHVAEIVRIVASLYPGEPLLGVGKSQMRTATVDADLTQLGSS